MDVEERFNQRAEQLHRLGLNYNFDYESYVKDDINVHWTDINCMEQAEWDKLISEIVKRFSSNDNTDPYCISQIA